MFGVHYEADNSRLYVVCAKHLTQTQLLDEFKVFGTAEVKLNCDVNGFSKVLVIYFLHTEYRGFSSFLSSQSFRFLASFFLFLPFRFFFSSSRSPNPPFVFASLLNLLLLNPESTTRSLKSLIS